MEALCEQCAGAKSVAFCRQCTEFICGECVVSHKKLKVFSGHVVASLEDLKKGGVKNIPLKAAPPPPMLRARPANQDVLFRLRPTHLS